MTKETFDRRVGENKYHIVAKETSKFKRVSVYEYGSSTFYRYGENDMVTNKQFKGRFYWFGKDTTPPIEKMVTETLNEAVCILENKQEKEETFEQRVEQAIETVGEVHE